MGYDYKIQKGDTLWAITGGDWNKIKNICKKNNIDNPDLIFANANLKLDDEDLGDNFHSSRKDFLKSDDNRTGAPPKNSAEKPSAPPVDLAKASQAQNSRLKKAGSSKPDGTVDESILSKNAQPLEPEKQKIAFQSLKIDISKYTEAKDEKGKSFFNIELADGSKHQIKLVRENNSFKVVETSIPKKGRKTVNVYNVSAPQPSVQTA